MNASRAAPRVGGPFELIDHHGRSVSDQSYAGRKVLMLFGSTRCRVACPRSLRRVSAAMDRLGPAAEGLVALCVTVDPDRDAPETMRAFLAHDHPRFTGLTGSRAQIDRVLEAFRVHARRRSGDGEGGDPVIAHTTLAYLLDERGAYSTHFALELDEAGIVNQLRMALEAPVRAG